MIRKEDTYKIGVITKTHGLKGEVVFCFDDDIFDRVDAEYLILDMDGILVPFYIESCRFRSAGSALIRFEGMDTAEKTADIVGHDVYFENRYVTESEDGEVSLNYFVGFTVKDTGAGDVGTITDINDDTDNWLFVVDDAILIPASDEFIVDIDHDGKVLTMDLPEGLINLNK